MCLVQIGVFEIQVKRPKEFCYTIAMRKNRFTVPRAKRAASFDFNVKNIILHEPFAKIAPRSPRKSDSIFNDPALADRSGSDIPLVNIIQKNTSNPHRLPDVILELCGHFLYRFPRQPSALRGSPSAHGGAAHISLS